MPGVNGAMEGVEEGAVARCCPIKRPKKSPSIVHCDIVWEHEHLCDTVPCGVVFVVVCGGVVCVATLCGNMNSCAILCLVVCCLCCGV